MARHSLRMLWIAWLFFRIACAMRENAHAGLLHSMSAFDNLSANVSANVSANGTLRAVANATVEDMLQEMAQQQAKSELQPFPDDPFKDDPWFQKRRDPNYDPFKDDPWKNRNDPFNNRNKDPFNNRNSPSPSPSPPSSDHSWSGHEHITIIVPQLQGLVYSRSFGLSGPASFAAFAAFQLASFAAAISRRGRCVLSWSICS